MLLIILSLIFLILDQLSKIIIIRYLNNDLTIIKNFLYLKYAQNNGAAFSILEGERLFLILISLAIIGLIIYYVKKNKIKDKLSIVSFALIIGGSLGNLIDRVVRSYVVDFIAVKIFKYNFPIFNIADSLICIGIFFLLISSIRKEK